MTYKYRGTQPPGLGFTPADYWVVGDASGGDAIGYAANSDRTSWTFYGVSHVHAGLDGAYGKDGSGNGIYVFSQASSTTPGELAISSDDVTDGQAWTGLNLPGGGAQFCDAVAWSNDSTNSTSGVWMIGRRNGDLYRSTDGASSFSQVTTPNDSGHQIFSIAGNGSGKFVTGQQTRLLISTDNGASFSSSQPFSFDGFSGVAYTNSTWIVAYIRAASSNLLVRTASDSDLTTWSAEVDTGIARPLSRDNNNTPGARASLAAAEGRVVIVSNKIAAIARLDVDGTSTSNLANPTYSGANIRDITTDGQTWMIVTMGGDIYESTDNGASFTQTVDDIRGNGRDIQTVAASKHLPL
tara:strand:- start:7650 stop:8708 length:1059 start_codon:yes stop_codon:yes gene_type:complete